MDFRSRQNGIPSPVPNLHTLHYLLLLSLLLHSSTISTAQQHHPSGDAAALLALKSAIDPSNTLQWPSSSSSPCSWPGIKECTPTGRVTKLVLEHLNLSGPLPASLLAPLDQLRVLSLQSNALTGPIPDLYSLPNLKSLYLSDNKLTGTVPQWLPRLHRLKVVALAGNDLEGTVPKELGEVARLYALFLQDNKLTGPLPDLKQDGLRFLNVSNNRLAGEVPTELAKRFNASSFAGNLGLCGAVVGKPCSPAVVVPPPEHSESSDGAGSAGSVVGPVAADSTKAGGSNNNNNKKKKNKSKIAAIVAGSVGGFLVLVLCLVGLACCVVSGNRRASAVQQSRSVGDKGTAAVAATGDELPGGGDRHPPPYEHGKSSGGPPPPPGGFSWESEGLGKLIFCGGVGDMYSLEDLLKASAETLGRGAVGSTYKAVMESGFIVTVKRLRDPGFPDPDEFRRRMEVLGTLRHPNLVSLRAYFQAKEERLLVYDYFPNGSLYSLIHGSRPSGSGKPLHWTSCLKIAEDVATGLLYLHQQSPAVVHGDLKSTNVLLGSDFESCLTDYGLVPAFRPYDIAGTEDIPGGTNNNGGGAASLFYRAPETRSRRPSPASFTSQSDVYSFGVLLLELLTGKTPFQDLVDHRGGADVPRWVRAVREEEAAADSSGGDDPVASAAAGNGGGPGTGSSGNEASEEKLGALLAVAMACIAQQPDTRPRAKEVLRMIRDARAEVLLVSSNSSDRSPSPARWSDTVQSLPREYGSEHINFVERD